MNISVANYVSNNYYRALNFGASMPITNTSNPSLADSFLPSSQKIQITSNVFDNIETFTGKLPQRIELSKYEQKALSIINNKDCSNVDRNEQKNLLKHYYTRQAKEDRNTYNSKRNYYKQKLRQIAEKLECDELKLETRIKRVKEYNIFAPKLFKATTVTELNQIKNKIFPQINSYFVKKALEKVYEQCLKSLR